MLDEFTKVVTCRYETATRPLHQECQLKEKKGHGQHRWYGLAVAEAP